MGGTARNDCSDENRAMDMEGGSSSGMASAGERENRTVAGPRVSRGYYEDFSDRALVMSSLEVSAMSRPGRMLIVLFLIACSWSSDRPLSATIHRPAGSGRNIDQDYVLALTTANEFLETWRHRTVPQAIALLSPEARRRYHDPEHLFQYLSGISNPHHQAYEVRMVAPSPRDESHFPCASTSSIPPNPGMA